MSYQNFKFQAIDAYAVMGDVSGMAEKMQSFFLQEVLSQTHAVLRDVLHEVQLYSLPFSPFLWYANLLFDLLKLQ
jgi:Vacuolar-sorting protein 54, of GARP complex